MIFHIILHSSWFMKDDFAISVLKIKIDNSFSLNIQSAIRIVFPFSEPINQRGQTGKYR